MFLFNELSKLAAAALQALGYLWTLGVVYAVIGGPFVFLQLVGGCFALFHEYICIPGGLNPKGKVLETFLLFPFVSLRKNGQVDYTPDCDQGSGKHGIVSSLPEGLGQASGRVDVPDDAKFEAAAAFGGTLRSWPGNLDALGLARTREGKIQFFLKRHDGCTRGEYVAAVRAERFSRDGCGSGGKSGKFQWVAHPDSGTGTRPKRHSFLKFPFLVVMLVPGQQRLTVFCLRLFWVPRPHPVFQVLWQVQVLSSVLDTLRMRITRWMVLLWGAPPAVTPNAVSGWGQFCLEFPRLRITRWMVLLLGAPPRCDPTCGQREGAVSLALGENTDEDELSSAGAGGWRTVPSTPSARRCSSLPGAGIRRVCGWRANPPLKGGSGAVLPAQRAQRSRGLRGRGTSFFCVLVVPHPCVVLLVLCGLRRVLTVLICLSNSVNLTLHVPIASMSHCLRTHTACMGT